MYLPIHCILFLFLHITAIRIRISKTSTRNNYPPPIKKSLPIDISSHIYVIDRPPPGVVKKSGQETGKVPKYDFSDNSPSKKQIIEVINEDEVYPHKYAAAHPTTTTQPRLVSIEAKVETPSISPTTATIDAIKQKNEREYQYKTRSDYDSKDDSFLVSLSLLIATFTILLIIVIVIVSLKYCCLLRIRIKRREEIILLADDESVMLRLIGSGGFGQVYELVGQKPAAVIKIMNASPKFYESVEHEYKHLKLMKHPNVVRLLQTERMEKRGEVGIVMEYCQRGDLKKLLLDQTIVYSMKTVYCWTVELLNALQYIFDTHSVIHRDIKPENVFITDKWCLKIGDFGLAKFIQQTQTGTFAGTLRYMSPLQRDVSQDGAESSSGRLLDSHRNDVYGIGLVLWEMVERRTVLVEYDRNGWFDRDLFNQDVTSKKLQKVAAPNCPRQLQEIIERCTNFDLYFRPKAIEIFEEMKAHRSDSTISKLLFLPIEAKKQTKTLRPIGFDGTDARVPVETIDLTITPVSSF